MPLESSKYRPKKSRAKRLEDMDPEVLDVEGAASLRAELTGTAAAPRLRVELEATSLSIEQRALGDLTLHGAGAWPDALAVEAARAQGRYWEFSNALLDHHASLDDAVLLRTAAEVGLDLERFRTDIERGRFLEYAEVHDHLYGTPREPIEKAIAAGYWVLLDIDVQGAEQLRANRVEGVYVLIAPPSMEELRRRLEGRGTDAPDDIELRLRNAQRELERADLYDHVVVNDDLERAFREVCELVGLETQDEGARA